MNTLSHMNDLSIYITSYRTTILTYIIIINFSNRIFYIQFFLFNFPHTPKIVVSFYTLYTLPPNLFATLNHLHFNPFSSHQSKILFIFILLSTIFIHILSYKYLFYSIHSFHVTYFIVIFAYLSFILDFFFYFLKTYIFFFPSLIEVI